VSQRPDLDSPSCVIDARRFYHCCACQTIVAGRMLIGPNPPCVSCGFRTGWSLIPMGQPKAVLRTIVHAPR
jgi:hypothetical protein